MAEGSPPVALAVPSPGGGDRNEDHAIVLLHRLARQNPRNPQRVLEDALDDLRFAPDLADEAFYSIPYAGSSKPVSGPSIRAAETLARTWGNNVATAYRSDETDDFVELTGRFVDLETLHMVERPFRAPKRVKRKGRDGREDWFETLRGEKLAQAVSSGVSKAIRNAILAGIPKWLTHRYDQEARKLVEKQIGQEGSEAREAFLVRMKTWAEKLKQDHGVTDADLDRVVGLPFDQWTSKAAAALKGFENALKEGIVTAEGIEDSDEKAERRGKAADALRDRARARDERRAEARAAARADAPGERHPGDERVQCRRCDRWVDRASVDREGLCTPCGFQADQERAAGEEPREPAPPDEPDGTGEHPGRVDGPAGSAKDKLRGRLFG